MKKKVIYQLILDRSGSMNACASETISGFNEQIQRIRELEKNYPEQEIRINLTLFNHEVSFPFFNEKTSALRDLNEKTYLPDGMTALYDGIGMSVARLKKEVIDDDPFIDTRVYVVILTDGYENASHEYNRENISGMIKKLESTGRWSFSYLGATPDAVDIAVSLNIRRRNSVRFSYDNVAMELYEVSENFSKFMHDINEEEDPY